jgi:hypothetical protein
MEALTPPPARRNLSPNANDSPDRVLLLQLLLLLSAKSHFWLAAAADIGFL